MGFETVRARRRREEREALHVKFRHLLIRGKARINFLRAALWRQEAMATMNRFVEEERATRVTSLVWEPLLRVSKGVKQVAVSKKGVIPRSRQRRDAEPARDEAASGPVESAAARDPPNKASRSLRRFAWRGGSKPVREPSPPPDDAVLRVDEARSASAESSASLSARPPRSTAPRFRSHAVESAAPGPSVRIELSWRCRVRGACFVSSAFLAHDERLSGWRFLEPGVSALRVEFRVTNSDLHLVLDDFQTNQSAVDVTLDGGLVAASRTPGDPDLPLPALDVANRHVLEIALCAQATPWAYHLRRIDLSPVAEPPKVPSPADVPGLLRAIPRVAPSQVQQRCESLHAAYRQGFRDYERHRRLQRIAVASDRPCAAKADST